MHPLRPLRSARRLLPALALLTLAACGGAGGGDTVYVGVAVPAGSPGGRAVQRAAELAVAEANARGGAGGRRVELVVRDDGGEAEQAIRVATELRDDPRVIAVIGHVNSSATLAAAGVYNAGRDGVVEISPTASNPAVSQAGEWTFRVSPSDLAYGPEIARWLAAGRGRRAAVLYENDEYGRGMAQTFSDAFRRGGGRVVAADPYLSPRVGDGAAAAYLARAMRRGMDALVIAGTAEDAHRLVGMAREAGFTGPVVGADGLLGIEGLGPASEGTYVGAAFFADDPSREARAFVAAYTARYREAPNADGALGYDAARVVLRALAEAGPDRRAVRDYIAGIGTASPPLQGATGTIRFDANGDAAGKAVAIGVVRGRRVVLDRS